MPGQLNMIYIDFRIGNPAFFLRTIFSPFWLVDESYLAKGLYDPMALRQTKNDIIYRATCASLLNMLNLYRSPNSWQNVSLTSRKVETKTLPLTKLHEQTDWFAPFDNAVSLTKALSLAKVRLTAGMDFHGYVRQEHEIRKYGE